MDLILMACSQDEDQDDAQHLGDACQYFAIACSCLVVVPAMSKSLSLFPPQGYPNPNPYLLRPGSLQ